MSDDEQELREMRETVRRIKDRWKKIREDSAKELGMKPIFIAVRNFIDADDRDVSGLPLDSLDVQTALDTLKTVYRNYRHDDRWDVIEIRAFPLGAKTYEGALRRREFP